MKSTDLLPFKRYIRSLARDEHVKVTFTNSADNGRVSVDSSSNELIVPVPLYTETSRMDKVNLDELRYKCLDGLLYLDNHKNVVKLKDIHGTKDDSPLKMVFKDVEQSRLMRNHMGKYLGDDSIIQSCYTDALRQGQQALSGIDQSQLSKEDITYLAGHSIETLARRDWNAGAQFAAEDYVRAMPQPVQDKANEVLKNNPGLVDEINSTATCEDSLRVSKKLYEILTGEDADQHMQDNQQGDEGEEWDGKQGGVSEQVRDSAGASGAVEAGEDDQHDARTGRAMANNYRNADDQNREDTTGLSAGTEKNKAEYHIDWDYVDSHARKSNAIARHLRRVVDARAQAYYVGGQARGPRFHTRSLHRACVPKVGDGSYNERIRKRKFEDQIKDACVVIVTDFSGSMHGDAINDAAVAAKMVTRTLQQNLQVPVAIVGFSTEVGVCKNFDQPYNDNKFNTTYGVLASEISGGTLLGKGLLHAEALIAPRKETKKIVIVLTDGDTHDRTVARDVVTSKKRDKNWKFFGISLGGIRYVENIFDNAVNVNNPEEIPDAILRACEQAIIG